jgi:hypothetical protein
LTLLSLARLIGVEIEHYGLRITLIEKIKMVLAEITSFPFTTDHSCKNARLQRAESFAK